ncbi:phosphotransferase [Nocardioides caeni]|uniref:Uncharacterized protein n=1 Tax=Nocardioides caeni TaxID=574700 RepID=A0A4S8NL95_9ACTN|nr:phosphotransferase [Nocardioides caeni]THV17648.1 hypothetical protein E9934_03970 [Nocardioides caeni]
MPLPVLPHGRTARRVAWSHLPPTVRSGIEQRIGAPVVDAISQDGGFTPGFASVLAAADGTRHFVKAAATIAQRPFAESYREEVRKLRLLPAAAPAPRLLWADEIDGWYVLSTEYVDARAPHRPWTDDDLAAASAVTLQVADLFTPAPPLDSAVDEFAAWPSYWQQVDHPRAAELRALAAGYAEVVAGETLVHTDVRDDNLLIRPDGSALLCDWNWPVAGANWLDSLMLLIGPRGDGLDVEAHITAHPLLSVVPPGHVDVALALLLGYFAHHANQAVPPSSPHVRRAQAWQRDVVDGWLAERRGW